MFPSSKKVDQQQADNDVLGIQQKSLTDTPKTSMQDTTHDEDDNAEEPEETQDDKQKDDKALKLSSKNKSKKSDLSDLPNNTGDEDCEDEDEDHEDSYHGKNPFMPKQHYRKMDGHSSVPISTLGDYSVVDIPSRILIESEQARLKRGTREKSFYDQKIKGRKRDLMQHVDNLRGRIGGKEQGSAKDGKLKDKSEIAIDYSKTIPKSETSDATKEFSRFTRDALEPIVKLWQDSIKQIETNICDLVSPDKRPTDPTTGQPLSSENQPNTNITNNFIKYTSTLSNLKDSHELSVKTVDERINDANAKIELESTGKKEEDKKNPKIKGLNEAIDCLKLIKKQSEDQASLADIKKPTVELARNLVAVFRELKGRTFSNFLGIFVGLSFAQRQRMRAIYKAAVVATTGREGSDVAFYNVLSQFYNSNDYKKLSRYSTNSMFAARQQASKMYFLLNEFKESVEDKFIAVSKNSWDEASLLVKYQQAFAEPDKKKELLKEYADKTLDASRKLGGYLPNLSNSLRGIVNTENDKDKNSAKGTLNAKKEAMQDLMERYKNSSSAGGMTFQKKAEELKETTAQITKQIALETQSGINEVIEDIHNLPPDLQSHAAGAYFEVDKHVLSQLRGIAAGLSDPPGSNKAKLAVQISRLVNDFVLTTKVVDSTTGLEFLSFQLQDWTKPIKDSDDGDATQINLYISEILPGWKKVKAENGPFKDNPSMAQILLFVICQHVYSMAKASLKEEKELLKRNGKDPSNANSLYHWLVKSVELISPPEGCTRKQILDNSNAFASSIDSDNSVGEEAIKDAKKMIDEAERQISLASVTISQVVHAKLKKAQERDQRAMEKLDSYTDRLHQRERSRAMSNVDRILDDKIKFAKVHAKPESHHGCGGQHY